MNQGPLFKYGKLYFPLQDCCKLSTGKILSCKFLTDYAPTGKGSLESYVESVCLNKKYKCNMCNHATTPKTSLEIFIESINFKKPQKSKCHIAIQLSKYTMIPFICSNTNVLYVVNAKNSLKLHVEFLHLNVTHNCIMYYIATLKSKIKLYINSSCEQKV